MAGAARKLANGMVDFAYGLYSTSNKEAASKLSSKLGKETAEKMLNKTGYKAGAYMGNSAALKGITGSFLEYSKMAENKKSVLGAIKAGHSVDGHLSAKRIAGTAFTAGVAGRVVTGGGLYRDRYGNFNLPGVPFI